MLRAMVQHPEFVTEQQKKLQKYVYGSIVESEKVVPLQVVYVKRDDRDATQIQDYHYAQDRSSKKWAMVTLDTGGSQLVIEGRIPRVAVLDTGCSSIILGRTFARRMQRCSPKNLVYGDTFVTTGGTVERSLGKTKE